jgi:outer membrane lipoprotein-sorting protein
MSRRSLFPILGLILCLFLIGCPKKVIRVPPPEIPPAENPLATLVEAFSAAETLQAKASIRIDTLGKDEEMTYRLQGNVFYQKPGMLRVYGYLPFPLPMDLFDALYRDATFFLLIPSERRAYTGEVSEFKDLITKADIRITIERPAGDAVPNRIRIAIVDKKSTVDIRLRDVELDKPLTEDIFQWNVPEGIEVRPLAQLIRRRPPN